LCVFSSPAPPLRERSPRSQRGRTAQSTRRASPERSRRCGREAFDPLCGPTAPDLRLSISSSYFSPLT
jgi:hypothetical protein